MEDSMSRFYGSLIAVSALFFFLTGANAGEKELLALNIAPAQEPVIKAAALLAPATAQAAPELKENDYDAFSAVDDPLYREGSKEFLEQAVRQDAVKEGAKPRQAPVLRDAPADTAPAKVLKTQDIRPALKKLKAKKPVHADPVKVKDTL